MKSWLLFRGVMRACYCRWVGGVSKARSVLFVRFRLERSVKRFHLLTSTVVIPLAGHIIAANYRPAYSGATFADSHWSSNPPFPPRSALPRTEPAPPGAPPSSRLFCANSAVYLCVRFVLTRANGCRSLPLNFLLSWSQHRLAGFSKLSAHSLRQISQPLISTPQNNPYGF